MTTESDRDRHCLPGGVVGIVGGGQLARMAAIAAAPLGFKCHVYCEDPESPALDVCAAATVAPYQDREKLVAFARSVDVITYEFENLPVASFQIMEEFAPVRPHWRCLAVTQHRADEKTFLQGLGIETADWCRVRDLAELENRLARLGRPAILKTARLGYDGLGQALIDDSACVAQVWRDLQSDDAVLEELVPFTREVSILVARAMDGDIRFFDVVENAHRDGILRTSTFPAPMSDQLANEARRIGRVIAEAFELQGLLAVEMFVVEEKRLLVNELAVRPHNSGHVTIDACLTSQFEQFIRAVTGLSLGSPARYCDAEMTNLIGDDITLWTNFADSAIDKLHVYGKSQVRAGRKMGHVTRLFMPDSTGFRTPGGLAANP